MKVTVNFDLSDRYENQEFEDMQNARNIRFAWNDLSNFLRDAYKHESIEDVEKMCSRAVKDEELDVVKLIRDKLNSLEQEYGIKELF